MIFRSSSHPQSSGIFYGTMVINKYTAKITKSTAPCITVVLPVRNAIDVMKSDKNSNTVDLTSMPSVSGICVYMEITATAGMVSPIVANADPIARLRLVWSRFFCAARTAAIPSGKRTTAAIIIPTSAFGAPERITPSSITGDNVLASKTIIARDISSSTALMRVMNKVGGGAW
jgi:hypothetical protein